MEPHDVRVGDEVECVMVLVYGSGADRRVIRRRERGWVFARPCGDLFTPDGRVFVEFGQNTGGVSDRTHKALYAPRELRLMARAGAADAPQTASPGGTPWVTI